MDDIDKEIREGFLEEVTQLLADVEQCFLVLESNPNDTPTLEKIFRIAHNVKGSAKAVGFESLGDFTHEFETFMLNCKSGIIPIGQNTISLLLKCSDHVKEWISVLKNDMSASLDNQPLIAEIRQFKSEIHSESLSEKVMVVKEDVSSPKKYATAEVNEIKAKSDNSIRVSLSRLDGLLNFVGEMVILQTVLREQAYATNPQVLRRTIHQLGKVTKEVQEISMSLRMVPLNQTFQKMKRIVRDISAQLGKRVHLVLEGEDTEVDKTVLEALGDPLVHLIRNAVDHGIETPSERVSKGKSEVGKVVLKAYHQSSKLIIEIKDNGAGISVDRLKEKALEKGILKSGQIVSDKEAISLIFHSGLTTKTQVTEVSGRGVGMDVVKTNIEQIQGKILVDTVKNEGSTFKIVLPLTLAIIDGMVVRCGGDRYVIPLSHVHETVKPDAKVLKYSSGIGETLLLRGENLPVVRLSHALGRNPGAKTVAEQIAIVVRAYGQPFATLVDDVIGQHEVVIKKLGNEMQGISGYSGSAILGDGKPALILELGDLVGLKTNVSESIKGQVAI